VRKRGEREREEREKERERERKLHGIFIILSDYVAQQFEYLFPNVF
jgi:hypothetical protein